MPPTRAQDPSGARSPAPAARKEIPLPFQVGEKLEYSVSWASFTTAASMELSIPERRNLYGWQTWHFRATAHTAGTVRRLFPIDDEFDSYADGVTLESRQYEAYLNELGRSSVQKWQFVMEGQTPRGPGPSVIVFPGTRDPLGALYGLRSVDWHREREVRVPVYDGHKLYEMRAAMEAPDDPVEVSAGQFSATRIGIQLFQHDAQVPGVHFAVWLANEPGRRPVLMRAELPFGNLRVELIFPESNGRVSHQSEALEDQQRAMPERFNLLGLQWGDGAFRILSELSGPSGPSGPSASFDKERLGR
jgi:Protein of unknown function (DUF3108)